MAEIKHHREIHEERYHLLSQVAGTHAPLVRLTCNIEQVDHYWLAEVSKIELYGKKGDIVRTIEE